MAGAQTLRRQAIQRVAPVPRGQIAAIPAPTGGWNTRDPINQMPPTDAILLDNWFPEGGAVRSRRGSREFAALEGETGWVESLASYHAGDVLKLLASTGDSIYEISGIPVSLGSGFTNARWQSANFNGRLFLCNGADAPQTYDGSTLTASGWSGDGLTANLLSGVNVYKNRLYFWERDEQHFWYADINSITGTLTKFPLGLVAQLGGNLVAMGTISVDSGDGLDDMAAFVMSSGQVLVYQGSDPGADPLTAPDQAFSLVGIYSIAPPLSVRGLTKIGSDLTIMTTADYYSLTEAIRSAQLTIGSKVSGAVKGAAASGASLFGWQATHVPSLGMIIYNVPRPDGSYQQHVLNTQNGAWARYTGLKAVCWCVHQGRLFFGSDEGRIMEAEVDADDDGSPILTDGQGAWQPGAQPERKRLLTARAVLETQGTIDYGFGIGVDYSDVITTSPTAAVFEPGAVWDEAVWDEAAWAAERQIDHTWRSVSGWGSVFSVRVKTISFSPVRWLHTDVRFESGISL